MSEWKPGDVAMVAEEGKDAVLAIRTSVDTWRSAFGESGRRHIVTERPLVVIDPDSDADLSRLWRLLPDNLVSIDQLQAALREFASPTPPRPEEPLGLGAVVEDAEGHTWTQVGGRCWVQSGGDMDGGYSWHEIPAARVLSPGYTEDGAL